MNSQGTEKRKYPRVNCRFTVAYHTLEDAATDLTQLKNMSIGGVLLTTSKPFEKGKKLILKIRLPSQPTPVVLSGQVIESRQMSKGLIYETRLQFQEIDSPSEQAINKTLDTLLNKN